MLVSTRGRYALRVIIDLAEHYNKDYIPMKDIAARQILPIKYIEHIMPFLTKGNLVEGVHGKGGGYRLAKDPGDFTVGDVLRLTEGNLAPVACLEHNAKPCELKYKCKTFPMWSEFHHIALNYFDGITISKLMSIDTSDNYSI